MAIAGKEVGRSYVLLINFVLKGKEVLLIRYCTYTQNVSSKLNETVKRKILTLLFSSVLLFNIGCNNNSGSRNSSESDEEYSENEDNDSDDDGYKDGKYCAEVEYYNPSTGTRNTYDLDVEVESGELTVIYWPNSGWLDN